MPTPDLSSAGFWTRRGPITVLVILALFVTVAIPVVGALGAFAICLDVDRRLGTLLLG